MKSYGIFAVVITAFLFAATAGAKQRVDASECANMTAVECSKHKRKQQSAEPKDDLESGPPFSCLWLVTDRSRSIKLITPIQREPLAYWSAKEIGWEREDSVLWGHVCASQSWFAELKSDGLEFVTREGHYARLGRRAMRSMQSGDRPRSFPICVGHPRFCHEFRAEW